MHHESSFILEHEIYDLLSEVGIRPPKFSLGTSDNFQTGDEVVVKGLAYDLWHKSDIGALYFTTYSKMAIQVIQDKIKTALQGKFNLEQLLICEKLKFQKQDGMPSEGYVSIKFEPGAGPVIRLGFGGLQAELLAQELKTKILTWPIHFMSEEEAIKELKAHLLGRVWLGKIRQGKPLMVEHKLHEFVFSLYKLASLMADKKISFIEVNPIVVDEAGELRPLDGVGLIDKTESPFKRESFIDPSKILSPDSFAVAGVSQKKGNFGMRIVRNLKASSLNPQKIVVIKPGDEVIEGLTTVPSLSYLKDRPVSTLILSLPATSSIDAVETLINQGGGADVVYLVAGGIGDGGDHEGLSPKLENLLQKARSEKKWTPLLIGPNSLGIVLSAQKISTLFISNGKLPINFSPKGNIGFVSQSGAFFITKISNSPELPIKNGFCIGNQFDLRLSDFLSILGSDHETKVIAVYVEGFKDDDLETFAHKAKALQSLGKKVVLFKGGRSEKGQKAAAGHTGAMSGNFELQKRVLELAGVFVTETFKDFEVALKWFSAFPSMEKLGLVAFMMNAGFESVASADLVEAPMTLSESDQSELKNILTKHNLQALVGATNPLDLTPMADEAAYLDCAEFFLKKNCDTLILSIVPLTDKIESEDEMKIKHFAESLKKFVTHYKKPIGVTIDSGSMYKKYKSIIEKESGLPVFNSIEEPLRIFN